MNKRCIVNVATGDFYCKMQKRLAESFTPCVEKIVYNGRYGVGHNDGKGKGIDLLLWDDILPLNSRPHEVSPYGFKVHAINSAYRRGYTSILWIDSPAYAVKDDISPIFDKIEKEGYYAMSHIDPLENWMCEKAMNAYAKTYSDLKGLNLPSGTCYGFDFKNMTTRNLFSLFEHDEREGLFKSFPGSTHRHDESILALILLSLDLPVFTFDPLFQSDSPECVIRSGDFGPMEQAKHDSEPLKIGRYHGE